MSYSWGPSESELRARVREHAVNDVLAGMSMIGAAVLWDVRVDVLQLWVDDARADQQDES